MLVDLHTHTNCSDGLLTPSQLVRQAVKGKVDCLAITDHDTVAGCQEAVETVNNEKLPITIVKGIEFSIDAGKSEFHLLGLFIDDKNEQLNESLNELQSKRIERVHKILAALNSLGFPLDFSDIIAQAKNNTKSFGRPHIAAALVKKEYFKTEQEAFEKVLYFGGPAYIENERIVLKEAVELIHNAGGLAIVAHPYKIKEQNLLKEAVTIGVDGLEAYYPYHTPEMIKLYLAFAHQYKLKVSGGSDYHGIKNRYPNCLGQYLLCSKLLNVW